MQASFWRQNTLEVYQIVIVGNNYGMCNVMCRLKIERLLFFELDYEVMVETTQIFVNMSCITNCIVPNIESHIRTFFPFAWLVTSIRSFYVELNIKAMLWEKEMFYKGRFKVLYFTNTNTNWPFSLWHGMTRL